MTSRLTVVGARGFIGSVVSRRARDAGWEVAECSHDRVPEGPLGTVIYCSGVAWDADRDPVQAYRVHAAAALSIVEMHNWERIVYVSSTRVYDEARGTSESDAAAIHSDSARDVYALSKLAGEGIVISASPENRVVRCSNVYGESFRSGLFLSDILRQAASTGRIELRSSRESAKDYISVEDVAQVLLRLARGGSQHALYNVAAGRNTSHGTLLEAIAAAVPVEVAIAAGSPTVAVREIDVRRIQSEFPFVPRDVVADVPALAGAFVQAFSDHRG